MSSYKKRRKYGMRGLAINENLMAVHDWNLDPWGNALFLVGEPNAANDDLDRVEPGVEFQMANRFIKNLRFLSTRNPNHPILVHMKSSGGFDSEGMAIYDAIVACPNKVTILSYSHARSMTSIILQAADKRVLMPHSYFLFHWGTSAYEGNYKSVQSAAEFDRRSTEKMLDIYVASLKHRSGKFSRWAPEKIREKLIEEMNKKEDVYLTAQEAVRWGFADAVFDGKWHNLTKYRSRG